MCLNMLNNLSFMRRILTCLFLSFFAFSAVAQVGHVSKGYPDNIPAFSYYITMDDPVFDYIRTYAPSYFFEEVELGKKSNVTLSVRSFFNYSDNKTLSQVILTTESGEMRRENTRTGVDDFLIWESIDMDEIKGILEFLSSIAPLKSQSSDHLTRVYNSRHGLLFLAKGNEIDLRFPETTAVRHLEAEAWIPLFEQAAKMITESARGKEVFNAQLKQSMVPRDMLCSADAHLEGRSVLGTIPLPKSSSGKFEGVVVVQIKVNQYGEVTEAISGSEGTTVTDKSLWTYCRNAALKAHFNQKADAPAIQLGTITYRFNME